LSVPAGNGKRRRVGFVCVGREPIEINHGGRTYLFEWTGGCGWMPVNRDGSERLSRVPNAVWEALERVEWPED
jgi:hypothetical protein